MEKIKGLRVLKEQGMYCKIQCEYLIVVYWLEIDKSIF